MPTTAAQTWAFPAVFTRYGTADFGAAFPDVPEVLTGAGTLDEARALAADALEEAILGRLARGEAVPPPRAAEDGEELVVLDPVTAARAALAQAMAAGQVTTTALAQRLGKSERVVRRLINGAPGAKLNLVLRGLVAVGQRGAFALV